MSLVEAVRKIVTSKNNERVSLAPTPKLQSVVDRSKIPGLFEQLSSTPIETEKEIIEDGKKMVIASKWGGKASSFSQIVVSVTESSISFIGSASDNQYIRLEGKNMHDSRKIERSLKKTFSNPQVINI
jgi:hypothetical protein